MDRYEFDDFTRAIGGTATRRRFSGMLAALGLGSVTSLSLLGADEADAKKKKRRKARKRRRKNRGDGDGGCVPDCTGLVGAKQCGDDGCGGSCGTCSLPLICKADGTCGTIF